ncbi:MAG: hypothetical protein RL653_42 [Pseudomonadota bacterium]|jgi:cytoskeletal protein CcmA (bactofilin family)
MGEQVQGDRIVVAGASAGSHFPRTQAEMEFNWEANGLGAAGPFEIDGSVYGKSLRFRGPGTVHGTVLGRGDVTCETGAGQCQRFLAGLAASGNLVCSEWPAGLRDTTVGDIRRARMVVRGDVMAENLALDGAVVFGNVEATRVRLSHCLVLGSVVAHESLTVRASTLFAYHAGTVTFEGPCALVHAMGESLNLPVMAPYQDLSGAAVEPSVELYPLVRGTGSLFNRSGLGEGVPAARLSLDTDWVKVTRPDGQSAYVLSIMGRALNLRAYGRAIEEIYTLLRTALEFEHYSPRDQARTRERWAGMATAEELWVLEQSMGGK